MVIDKKILDDLTEQAKASPRLRMNYDLRNSVNDQSQRMLNALEPGTILPIHRHHASSEINICLRGHYEEYLYGFTKTRSDGTPDPDSFGIVETIDMYPGGPVLNIPADQWHSLKCLESGTVLFECKDGPYAPLAEDEIL
jgi:cupin fold WbuC family metalloprotein